MYGTMKLGPEKRNYYVSSVALAICDLECARERDRNFYEKPTLVGRKYQKIMVRYAHSRNISFVHCVPTDWQMRTFARTILGKEKKWEFRE